ncbi:MAG TPA: MotA/TolQ/ExbB proton channel family protein [Bryobacteraceae bacterium]|nr:MotA/TolQ/ExbB proton channel family protein [Bryobacteraceae bacterium]
MNSLKQIGAAGVHFHVITGIALAQYAARRSAAAVHRQMARGLFSLASVAVTAPLVGFAGTVWGIVDSFRGCNGERSAIMAAVAERLSWAFIPAALALLIAITASWGHKHLSARMADFDCEMQGAVRDLPDYLAWFS